jgi:hypothetical protein
MIDERNLREILILLAKKQVELIDKGGPFTDGKLFENILNIQELVLEKFGLPINPVNEAIIYFEELPTDFEIDNRITQLHKTATEFLLSKGKSELQILKEAKEFKLNALVVLPEIKITTHIYTCFVYDEILLKNKDSVENVLEDLKFVNNYKCLNEIWDIVQADDVSKSNYVAPLLASKIKYIDQFINHYFKL